MINSSVTPLRALTVFSVSILLAACASGPPKPTVDYKADYDFSAVKTIAFYRNSGEVLGDNPMQLSDIQRDRIDEALSYALTHRGFQMVTAASTADLLLSWTLDTQNKTDVRTYQTPTMGMGMGRGYGGYYGGYNRYSAYNCWNCSPTRT
ncbi:MAG: DUF4136 domain-containing protein, partial [Halioglobus sp.]